LNLVNINSTPTAIKFTPASYLGGGAQRTLTTNAADTQFTVTETVGEFTTSLTLGTLATTDPDTGETFTYTVSEEAQDTLEVVGSTLKTKGNFDFEREGGDVMSFTITSTDSFGNTITRAMRFNILNDLSDDVDVTVLLEVNENDSLEQRLATFREKLDIVNVQVKASNISYVKTKMLELRTQIKQKLGVNRLEISGNIVSNLIKETIPDQDYDVNSVAKLMVLSEPDEVIEVTNSDLTEVRDGNKEFYFFGGDGESTTLRLANYDYVITYTATGVTYNGQEYGLGDTLIFGDFHYTIKALGSLVTDVTNPYTSSSSGDPYITTLSGKQYKLKDEPGVYRIYEGKDLIINAETKLVDNFHRQRIHNYGRISNLIDEGTYYSKLYIKNYNDSITVDMVTRQVEFDINSDNLYIEPPYYGRSNYSYYKNVKAYKIPIILQNKQHGAVKIELEFFDIPQIENGFNIEVSRRSNNDIGLLVDTYREKDMKLSHIKDLSTKQHKKYKIVKKKEVKGRNEYWTSIARNGKVSVV